MTELCIEPDFQSWRDAARGALADGLVPRDAVWTEVGLENALIPGLAPQYGSADRVAPAVGHPPRVPKEFVPLARSVACHRDADRWAILYRTLWRLTHGEPHLLNVVVDDDVHRLLVMRKQVSFDAHKMKAFVRFRSVPDPDSPGGEHFIAFHRSEHRVLRDTAPFFVRRFGVMRWTILTPLDSADYHPVIKQLLFGPGVPESAGPTQDALESLWRTYYANIFNPARIKLKAMRKEMPARYWATMPETTLIPDLIRDAPKRVEAMMAKATEKFPTAEPFLPVKLTLPALREASCGCKGCDLYQHATQTVFGEGAATALAMFVGEQPGDQEDRAGQPFVGPAGQLLNDALDTVGIDRADLYVTNAVKHFKFEPRGTRRIHAKPNAREIQACKPWLAAEARVVKPAMMVCLGATAAQALLGKEFRITRDRGKPRPSEWAPWTIATLHPSALLRIPDPAMRDRAHGEFLDDLRQIADQLKTEKHNRARATS